MTIRYTLHKQYQHLEYVFENIQDYFNASDAFIHDARNKLKIIEVDGLEIVVKAFRIPNYLNQFVYGTLRDSKAKKSYDHSIKLQILNITCPEPIGYIEFYDGILLKESYFLSLRSNYDFTIREPLLDHNFKDHDNIFTKFGEFTADIHAKGVLHNDYSPGNILITRLDNNEFKFDLVDINRMRFGHIQLKDKMKNLSKLWANENDIKLIATAYALRMSYDIQEIIQKIIFYDRKNKNIKTFKRYIKGKLSTIFQSS